MHIDPFSREPCNIDNIYIDSLMPEGALKICKRGRWYYKTGEQLCSVTGCNTIEWRAILREKIRRKCGIYFFRMSLDSRENEI